MNWTKVKPDKPCLFVTRDYWEGEYEYEVWQLVRSPGDPSDWQILSGRAKEYYSLENFEADEYMIIEEFANEAPHE